MISIAVDIGGTFTDVVAADSETGAYHITKVPTQPANLVAAVRRGALELLERSRAQPAGVARFIHGTTVGTNAVLERKGARTAVLATDGFEDVLEIGRLKRTRMYDLLIGPETPVFLAPKRRRRGVHERIGADGSVVVPLDEDQARAVIAELCDEQGVEAFAVSLLFSFRDPTHERRLRALIHEHDPTVGVSLSSEVDPTFREYERTVVTLFDAYLRPVVERYVSELDTALSRAGITAGLQIMQSRGGITSSALVSSRPVSVLLSGPAAGVTGARAAGEQAGVENLVTIDIGGTSADISLIAGGKPLVTTEGRIEQYPLRVPMIDVNAIGAGGGSIAWVDDGGGFRVGPQSAGADPGPAAYGLGGTAPTVTDASVVLGYLNPSYFAGGSLQLDPDAAWAAVDRMAGRLSLTATQTAAGIHRIVNAKMADAIRLVSIRRGYDPRDFALMPLGGAGSVHAGRLAAELAIPTLVVPPVPGVLSAMGLLVASIEHDAAATVAVRIDEARPDHLEEAFPRVQARVADMMAADGVPDGEAVTTRFADMRYVGQSYSLEVELPVRLDADALADACCRFHAMHQRIYGHARATAPVEVMNVRVVQSWRPPQADLYAAEAQAQAPGVSSRRVYFEEIGDYVDTPIHRRAALDPASEIVGPAIIEQPDTTIVVYPGHRAWVDDAGNILVRVGAARTAEPATPVTFA